MNRLVFNPRRGTFKEVYFTYSYLTAVICNTVMLIILVILALFNNFNDIGMLTVTYPYYAIVFVLCLCTYITLGLFTSTLCTSSKCLTVTIYLFVGIGVFLSLGCVVFFIYMFIPYKTNNYEHVLLSPILDYVTDFAAKHSSSWYSFQNSLTCCAFGDNILLATGSECLSHPFNNTNCQKLFDSDMITFIFTSITFSLLTITINILLLFAQIATSHSTTTYNTTTTYRSYLIKK